MTAVIGHRGASLDFPENTIAAFEGARAQGADWVELDVRLSRDGQLVVHHDALLADGRVITATDRAEMPATIPSLVDALAACRPMGVNIEIKSSPYEAGFDPTLSIARRTLEAIRSMDPPLEVLISSFELPTLEAVRAADPSMPTGYLVLSASEPTDAIEAVLAGGHVAIHPYDAFVTEALAVECRDRGCRLYVWTVDDPDRIAELGRWGVDGIITNRPALAREALGLV